MERVRVGDVTLAVETWGAAGPAVVLLHGLGGWKETWREVAEALAPSCRVHALDLRGHGASDRTAAYSLEAMRDDVAGYVDARGLGPATLVGHSMGGIVAYLLAVARPELVARLVLEEAPAPLPADPPRDPGEPDGTETVDWNAVLAVAAQRNRPDPAWWAALPSVAVPVLVVAGGQASHLPQEQQRALADRFPDARMVTVEGGHEVHVAQPAAFIDAVTGFVRV